MEDNEVETSEWVGSPGLTNISNGPFHTPVSAKGGRVNNRSKGIKGNRLTPQTPVSNAGEKISYHLGSLISYTLHTSFDVTVYQT